MSNEVNPNKMFRIPFDTYYRLCHDDNLQMGPADTTGTRERSTRKVLLPKIIFFMVISYPIFCRVR